ncbi:MAG: prephenate/arogenate dehydrogenase [Pseudanabaenaceae cyanobacterium]|jgi:arogenate dehydrogenase (NADP+)
MQIGIVGLGLIGGSLGLDLRTIATSADQKLPFAQTPLRVWGLSRSPDTCRQAVAVGAVDQAATSFDQITDLDQTDLIVICTPIAAILPTLKQLAITFANDPKPPIVTDVGSVKAAIVNEAQQIYPRFIGSHPMAGTAFQGINAAEYRLFQERPCVITPLPDHDPADVALVRSLWQSVGANVLCCSPAAHDRAVAWISHLPVMVSASLIGACLAEADSEIKNLGQNLASSGFRDTSRVGGGNPELGRLMAEYNRDALLMALAGYRQNLDRLTTMIENAQWDDLEAYLRTTQAVRSDYSTVRN